MKNGRSLVLFDFDGTITTRDSFIDFSFFTFGKLRIFILMIELLPLICLYFLKMYSGKKLKESFFVRLIKGWSEEDFDVEARKYTEKRLPAILKTSALSSIKIHRENGDEIALVSASVEQWLKYFAKDHGMKLIATKLEIKDGVFTGMIDGENCHGREKAKRVIEIYDVSAFEHIYAYGDTSGDTAMLDLADSKFFKYFK